MKKVLVLLSAALLSGCFICHKGEPQEEIIVQEIVVQEAPAPEENVIVRYSIPEIANFAFDSTEAEPDLDKIETLCAEIQAYPDAVIVVEGHTDNVGPEAYNKELSIKRAQAVAEELAYRGIPNPIRIYGAGSSTPIASNNTEAGRAQNRRVDVVLVRE